MFKRILLAGLVVSLFGLLSLGVSRYRRPLAPTSPVADADEGQASEGPLSGSKAGPGPSFDRAVLFDPEMDAEAVKLFRSYAVYPPDSRPLNSDSLDVMHPFSLSAAPVEVDMKATDRRTVGREAERGKITCTLHPQRHTVAEGETNAVRLFCQTMESARSATGSVQATGALPLIIHHAMGTLSRADSGGGESSSLDQVVAFNDVGRAGDEQSGDHVHTWSFAPQTTDVGDVNVTVRFAVSHPEGASEAHRGSSTGGTYELRTTFFSSPTAPARFTGRTRDGLLNGSMVVDVELDVRRAGRFQIAANLFKGTMPVAYATVDEKLEVGRRMVRLRFFGKIFRERHVAGVFELVALRGSRLNLPFDPVELATLPPAEITRIVESAAPTGPDREIVPPWPGPIKTQAYPLTAFSAEEWQSPAKDRRLADMQQTAVADDFGTR